MSIHEKLAQVQKEGKSLTPRLEMRDKLDELKRVCAEESEDPKLDSARKLITDLEIPELLVETVDLFPGGTTVSYLEDSSVSVVFEWNYRNDKILYGTDDLIRGYDDSFNELVLMAFAGEIYIGTCRSTKHVRYGHPTGGFPGRQGNYFSVTLKSKNELTRERVEATIVDALFKAGIRVPQFGTR